MKSAFLSSFTQAEVGPRKGKVVLLLILLLVSLQSVLVALSKPFFFDDICTIFVARLPSAGVIWKALGQGADPLPPAFYYAEHLARRIVPYDHLGYRALSILGTLIAISCVYFFLARRVSCLSALTGASFILLTPIAGFCATEVRPYALMSGCFAAALLAWQRIDDSRLYAIATFAALAAAVSLHYYAIFVWPAFMAAELVVWISRRRFRASAWAAIAAGCLPLALFAPVMLRQRQYFASHFLSSSPNFRLALFAHDWLFGLIAPWGLMGAAGLTAAFLWLNAREPGQDRKTGDRRAMPARWPIEEVVLTSMLLWLPLIVFAGARVGHGGMMQRYAIPAILGGALALGCVIERAPGAGRFLLLLIFLIGYTASLFDPLMSTLHGSLLEQREEASRVLDAIAQQSKESDLPVVISDGNRFLKASYYAPASARNKLYFLADPASAVAYSPRKSDTVEINFLALRHWAPLQVEDYGNFVSQHPEFILVTYYENQDLEWLPRRLLSDGHGVTLISSLPEQGYEVFKVTAKP